MVKNDRSQNRTRGVWTMLTWAIAIALLLSGCGGAQQAKVYHVGILSSGGSFDNVIAGFKAKMTELGYVEGKNVVYDTQESADLTQESLMAQKLVADKVPWYLPKGK